MVTASASSSSPSQPCLSLLGSSRHADSYYASSVNERTDYPCLEGELRVDVVIVGGGFTGVASAVELSERGLKVAIVEANKIGWGATGRNGGQVTGSLSGESQLRKHLHGQLGSRDGDEFLWNLRWRGHDIIKARVEKYSIDCDLKYGHLHTAYQPSHMKELQGNFDEACRRGMADQVELVDKRDIPQYLETELYHGGLLNRRNMHLHSLNLCIGEVKAAESMGARIFENSDVVDIIHGDTPVVVTEHGRITANSVLLAGNAYHHLEPKKMKGLIFPACGGNVVTEPLGDEVANRINPQDLAVYDCRYVLDYYRLTADKRLMLGGGANYSGRESRDIAAEMRPAIESIFPRLKGVGIEYAWSGMMGIVINRIPQLGKVSDNVYYAQGYSGHGVALTHIVAEIMAQAISGSMQKFDIFAAVKHTRLPFGDWASSQMMGLGMWYYLLMERFR